MSMRLDVAVNDEKVEDPAIEKNFTKNQMKVSTKIIAYIKKIIELYKSLNEITLYVGAYPKNLEAELLENINVLKKRLNELIKRHPELRENVNSSLKLFAGSEVTKVIVKEYDAQVLLENYLRNISNITELINNDTLLKGQSEELKEAHKIALEVMKEKLDELLEKHPELRANYDSFNKSIIPNVEDTYNCLRTEYDNYIIYNQYYNRIINSLKQKIMTFEELDIFLQKSKLTQEHKSLFRLALKEDGSFDFCSVLEKHI